MTIARISGTRRRTTGATLTTGMTPKQLLEGRLPEAQQPAAGYRFEAQRVASAGDSSQSSQIPAMQVSHREAPPVWRCQRDSEKPGHHEEKRGALKQAALWHLGANRLQPR